MIFKDFIKSLLVERKHSGKLFHFTKIKSLDNILKSGFLFSHQPYISLTRNPIMVVPEFYKNDLSFIKGEYNVRIQLNGEELSDKYKIEPFLDTFNNIQRHQGENEERIKKDSVFILDSIEEIQILKNKTLVEILSQKYPRIKIISVDNFKRI